MARSKPKPKSHDALITQVMNEVGRNNRRIEFLERVIKDAQTEIFTTKQNQANLKQSLLSIVEGDSDA